MNTPKVKAHLHKLADLVDNLEETLKPLIDSPESMAENLPLLDRAKYYAWYLYTIEAVLFAALQTCSVDPQAHPLKKEILRIKEHFAKIKAIEFPDGTPDHRKPPTINKEAVARVLKHDLGDNSNEVKRRLDELVAKERANALLLSLESDTPATATDKNEDGKRSDEPAMRQRHHHMETRAKTDRPLDNGKPLVESAQLGHDKEARAKIEQPPDNGGRLEEPTQLGNDKKGKAGGLHAPHDPYSGPTKNPPRWTLADAYTKPRGEQSKHQQTLEKGMAGVSITTATNPGSGQSPKKDVPSGSEPAPEPASVDKLNQKWNLASALGLDQETDPMTCYRVPAEDMTKQAHANIPGLEGPKCPEEVERHEQQVNTVLDALQNSPYRDRKQDGPLEGLKENPEPGPRPEGSEGPEGERPATSQERSAPPVDPSEKDATPAKQKPMRGASRSVVPPSPDPGPKLSLGDEQVREREGKPSRRPRKRQRHGQ